MTYTDSDYITALDRAVLTTLELMAFAEIAPAAEPAATADPEDCVWAGVDIAEPVTGKIFVYTRRETAEDIARLIHGCDGDDFDPALLVDAIGELANTIAGRCLATLLPDSETFRLCIPKTGDGPPPVRGILRGYIGPDEQWAFGAGIELER